MITYKAPIINPSISIKPSEKLYKYISSIKNVPNNIPKGISNILFKNKKESTSQYKYTGKEYLIQDEDRKFITSLNLKAETVDKDVPSANTALNNCQLGLLDVRWLYEYIQAQQVEYNEGKVYLHELLEGSELILPENVHVPRSEELEKRCQKLRIKQENRQYQTMTKNVDNVRRKFPEDTISYQMKEMNKQLIAIFQFILSVLAGFAFGFIGIELFVGTLDFGFRLLLGIIFALVVALAELYFLAKKLNEDLQYEIMATQTQNKTKLE